LQADFNPRHLRKEKIMKKQVIEKMISARKQAGFTVLELAVALSIIAILVAAR